MKRVLLGLLLLTAGLSLAQGVDYRQVAVAAAALGRLQTVAQGATGEEKLLKWAQEVKAWAERSFEAKAYFKTAREAQAALLLFRAARGEPQSAPRIGQGVGHGWGHERFAPKFRDRQGNPAPRLPQAAQARVERAEEELATTGARIPWPRTWWPRPRPGWPRSPAGPSSWPRLPWP